MIKKLIPIAYGSIILIIATKTFGIECDKTKTEVETLICHSGKLMKADRLLNKTYIEISQESSTKKKIRMEQKIWLSQNRDKCRSEECLIRAYADRQSELERLTGKHANLKEEYFCWRTDQSGQAPSVIEVKFIAGSSETYENIAWVRKYDNEPPSKIQFKRIASSDETEHGRPLEFVQIWNDISIKGISPPPYYEILFQGFPRHITFHKGGLHDRATEYEPWGAPSDTSCFSEAIGQSRPNQ